MNLWGKGSQHLQVEVDRTLQTYPYLVKGAVCETLKSVRV